MEPTDFEKWCAEETGIPVFMIVSNRKNNSCGIDGYEHMSINSKYRAYMAGVRSRLPYQTPPKGDEDEMD
ncbi:hypothetical protein [Morganella morganii]|uniref:hypothetical protein n=1 Tax=Morganella morganii TaxID=582 RepID=UPI000290F363|nr:hypothetical protein [Morganella morganii]AVK39079.1 hypothetical protein CSB69_4041 [Morganella morganii]EMP51316.1 hypothetical protein C790_01231 [Morganella morganii SC01]MBO8066115.1 hypothetical protein [Morganella morganii]